MPFSLIVNLQLNVFDRRVFKKIAGKAPLNGKKERSYFFEISFETSIDVILMSWLWVHCFFKKRNHIRLQNRCPSNASFLIKLLPWRPATSLNRHKCFPMKFAKFFRASFFTEHLRWLLLGLLILNRFFLNGDCWIYTSVVAERGLLNIYKCCCLIRYFFSILLVNLLIYKKMITSSFIEAPTWWNKRTFGIPTLRSSWNMV